MIITVKVTPKAKRERVKSLLDGTLQVWVNVAPEHNKANLRLCKLLSGYFKVSTNSIRILRGRKSAMKQVQIRSQ